MSAVDKAEKARREGIRDDHAQMLDAQAQCVPCKLCGGQAVIRDAGEGWGYHIACEAYGEHLRKPKCTQGGVRLSGWAYNVSDLWNRLNAAPVCAGKVKALVWEPVLCTNERAHAVGLCYEVAQRASSGEWFWWLQHLPHRKSAPFASAEAAKAAAQADCDARILSALQPGDGWQDISSAPKDGTRFLGRRNGDDRSIRAVWFVPDEDYGGENLMDEDDSEPFMTEWCAIPASLPQGEETR